MTIKITAKVLKAAKFEPGKIAVQMRGDLRKYSRKVVGSLNETTENWNNEKPRFKVLKSQVAPTRSSELFVIIGFSSPDGKGAKKWVWLDKGTSVRYATMSEEFRPKTRVGTTRTGTGRPPFDPRYVSTKLPRPGIEARGWTGIVQRRHQRGRDGEQSFPAAMRDSLKTGCAKALSETKG